MLRSLWLIIQIALLAALLIWAAHYPGTVTFDWLSHQLTIQIGLFFCALYALLFLTIHAHNIWKAVTGLPGAILRKMEERAKAHSFKTLTKGLSALAAGDTRTARRLSKKIRQDHFNETPGLLLLLQAQTARMEGKTTEAARLFTALSQDKNAGFLGLRALLQSALENNNIDQARILAADGLKRFHNNPWLLQAAYKIALQDQNWDEALGHLKNLGRFHILPDEILRRDHTAILIAKADAIKDTAPKQALKYLGRAHKTDPAFPPLIHRMVTLHTDAKHHKKARHVVKSAWKIQPHIQLIPVWAELIPAQKDKTKSGAAVMRWFEKLAKTAPDAPESHYALGQAACQCALWGEARDHFMKARTLDGNQPPQHWYRAMAALERAENHDEDAAQEWLVQAAHAPEDKVWLCIQSGQIYPHWMPVAPPHNSFNTIRWQRPLEAVHSTTLHQLQGPDRLAGLL